LASRLKTSSEGCLGIFGSQDRWVIEGFILYLGCNR
jgi:hypothetical protein